MIQNGDSSKRRILLVNDDASVTASVLNCLSASDDTVYDVCRVENSTSLINDLDITRYHGVLLVLEFACDPGEITPGLKSLERMRKKDEFVPVIVLSDRDDEAVMARALALNINGFLPKTGLNGRILRSTLRVALENEQRERKNRFLESQYRRMIDNLDDAYYENDLRGIYTYVNKAACRDYGKTKEELVGSNYRDYAPSPQMARRNFNAFNKVYKTGESGEIIENELVRPDGSILYTELSVSLIRDENDRITGFGGISRDVTEKRLAQQALKESEEKYRTILENMEDSYFEVDMKGRLLFFNPSLARLLGYDADELKGMRYTQYMDKENAERLKIIYTKIYETRKPQFMQYEVISKKGARLFHEATVSLLRNKDKKIVGFRGLSRDLTEKRDARMALEQSEERYKNILDSLEDGYYETDLKGRMTFCNDAACRMLGVSRRELLKRTYRDYRQGYWKRVSAVFKEVFQTGNPNRAFEYEVLHRKTGQQRYHESTVSLKKDKDGNPVGFFGIARDITDRKKIELELQKAKEASEEASRAKSEFLANMSHEIRTPMNGILGMYNLLLGTNLDSEQFDFVETGKRSAEALLNIINDILDFSKIEAGKMDIETIDFDLRRAVDEMVTLPAVQAHTKGLEFAYAVENRAPTLLRGDPGRLRQVIMNLCTNAVKFTPKGEVVFRVDVEEDGPTQVALRFSVRDTGIGISKEDQARLFSSFQQVDTSTTRKYGGTGLGLAISKKLVELMGGSIHVSSNRDQGSTFFFVMPFEKQENACERSFDHAGTIGNKRILIVDDNQTNLDILSGYLDHWNCTSDQALNSQMALSLMRAVTKAGAPYDIVITDYVMPEMDGAGLGRIIKSDPDLKDTRLIMLTSQGLRGDAAQMKRIGFSAYLNKPVRRSLLYDCLITVINNGSNLLPQKQPAPLVTAYSMSEKRRGQMDILLAEDNPVNQKLALNLLEKFGFRADAVGTGRQAVNALAQKDYHVVLMDIQMPDMDGLEATRVIRDLSSPVKDHGVLVIAMTAHAMKGDRNMCLAAGMDDYISKPIRPEALLRVIEKNIKRFDG